MNIANKDLNLLLVFHVLYQERNASLAAARMALSQPALSHKLNKLRHELGDAPTSPERNGAGRYVAGDADQGEAPTPSLQSRFWRAVKIGRAHV